MPQLQPGTNVSTLSTPDLIPVRMLNEFTYCPRLCYLEWIEQEWDENVFTLDGTHKHRRVDARSDDVPPPEELASESEPPSKSRSVEMSAPDIGIITKMDLLEYEDGHAIPVEYKRGKEPDIPEGAWEPERVQLCAQALILRENGYKCRSGYIYYAGSHKRVTITISDDLVERTLELISGLKAMMLSKVKPAPLSDSPKCPNCSLVGICLPDETIYTEEHPNEEAHVDTVRRLIPARDDQIPLYVQEQGTYIRKEGENIKVTFKDRSVINSKEKKIQDAKLFEISHVNVFGYVQISTQVIHEFIDRNIPLSYFSYGGYFKGMVNGLPHKNIALRQCQYQKAENPETCLLLAKEFVRSKILNCRTLLRRNTKQNLNGALDDLSLAEKQAQKANSLETLLGCEGNAARIYFQHFSDMLKSDAESSGEMNFDFDSRNRRPPKDPVNALLSYAYGILTNDWTITLWRIGLDPYLGFYHQPRYGRPALSLDMMEPFRPLIADSTVLTCINNNIVTPRDFTRNGNAVALNKEGRKRFLGAYERRMDSLITHPVFNYRISYRRVLEVQARLLCRYLTGEISDPPEFITR